MIVYPNAKINLGLNIINKRTDGFHNIESIFYPIGIHDILEIMIQPNPCTPTQFTSSGIPIPGNPESNLCLKAYHLLSNDFKIPSVQIHLHKIIPIGAGLGGGSSDAAFTLIALNKLCNLQLETEQLKRYACKLGSDCAFFIENNPTFNYNKGDEYHAIPLSLKDYYLVLLFPDIHIGTAEAYSGVRPKPAAYPIKNQISNAIHLWKNNLHNDFEDSLFLKYPRLRNLKEALYNAGAVYASLTGSGSAIYGIFEKEIRVKDPQLPIIWQGKL